MKNCFVCIILATVALVGIAPAVSYGTAYLSGAQLFLTNSTGAWNGSGWFFSTNTLGDGAKFSTVSLTGTGPGTAIAVPLSEGSNTIIYAGTTYNPSGYTDMNLFFNDTGTPLVSAAWDPNSHVAGDLIVCAPVNSTGFLVPAFGTNVISYGSYNGDYTLNATANGQTSLVVGSGPTARTVTVTGFTSGAANGPNGTITINVAPLPEPASLSLLALGGLALLRRRRK